jgi:Mismatch repair ATPase (MutS family)
MEAKVLGADDRAQNLEYQLFQKLRDETLREIEPIQQTADAIAVLDVLCALAETARLFRYCRPELSDSLRLVSEMGAIRCWIKILSTKNLCLTTQSWTARIFAWPL